MAIDLLGSVRSTALVSLVAASFSAPVVVKTDALERVTSKLPGGTAQAAEAAPPESLVAGGVQFDLPADWGRLGASAAAIDAGDTKRVGTVVSGICPGGSAGGDCKGGVKLTFVAYSGADGHSLPPLPAFEGQLDDRLATEYAGFAKSESKMRPGADGMRYLDYSFTWTKRGSEHGQRLAAFRHGEGAGVVVLATGAALDAHAEEIGEFLASAHEPLESAE